MLGLYGREFRACRLALLVAALWSIAALPAAAQAAGAPPIHYRVLAKGPHQPAVRLYVEEMGSGPPVVLLHGLGASAYSWRRVAPILAERFRVIAIDLRGHGRSDKPFDLTYAPAAQAELVRDVMHQLGLSGVTLVGHSYGGVVSLLATLQEGARRRPNRRKLIKRLVLMNAPAYPQSFSTGVALLRKPILPYVALTVVPATTVVGLALMGEAIGMAHITQEDIAIYAQPLGDARARHALIQTARQIIPPNAADVIAHYPSIRQPALVIWCRRDQVVPLSTGQRLADELPNASLAVIDHCDHATPEAAPSLTSKLIADFAGRPLGDH
jgi:pimeloyl-ACP methyl ester carboxylesterase